MDDQTISSLTSAPDDNKATYMIRPNFQHKFKKATVKECIHNVVTNTLKDKSYSLEDVPRWIETISNGIKAQLKDVREFEKNRQSVEMRKDKSTDMEFDRYKFVVQCVIGEQRGQDVKMSCRCFWDSDTDNYAQDVFMNSSIFCVTAAFGVFFY